MRYVNLAELPSRLALYGYHLLDRYDLPRLTSGGDGFPRAGTSRACGTATRSMPGPSRASASRALDVARR